MDKVKKARARMMIGHPFFATLMASSPWVESREIITAATDMKKIYYNPDFFESMEVPEIMFVIAHEVMHIALEHGLRLKSRNPTIWNMAADFAINWTLSECSKSNERYPMTMPKDPQTGQSMGLLDPQYADMSADQIYDDLMKRADKARQAGKTGDPRDGEDASGMPGWGDGQDDLKHPESAGNAAEEAKLRQSIQQRVAQAAQTARMAGNVPGALESLINQILEPAVPWPDILRDYMLAQVKDDESWSRRNRRFANIYLPTRHSECLDRVIVIGDSSGSMFSDEDLGKMAAEINGVFDMTQPKEMRLIWADTRVASDETFEAGDCVLIKPKGGGGTDMRVPLEYVEQYDPDFVILITDGYTPWPDSVPYPLIVVTTTTAEPPEGLAQVVRV